LVVLLQSADQVVLMPTREYDKLLAVVVQAEVCNGGVPLPAGFPDNGRITLLRILIQVVDYQDVDGIARKTAATADTQQTTPVADDFELIRGVDRILRRGAPFADTCIGKQVRVLRGSHITL